jgi:hypothetical protein
MTRNNIFYITSRVGEGGVEGKHVEFVSSFFVLPQFSCPLLGGFLAHGLFRWFSISS